MHSMQRSTRRLVVAAALAALAGQDAAAAVVPQGGTMRLRGGNTQFGHATAKGGRMKAFNIAVRASCSPPAMHGRTRRIAAGISCHRAMTLSSRSMPFAYFLKHDP